MNKVKSMGVSTTAPSEQSPSVVSQQYSVDDPKIGFKLTRARALSGPTYKRSKSTKISQKNKSQPKVMKYVQDFSEIFDNETVLLEECHEGSKVIYSKAEHNLDGQTYVLKKEHIELGFDEDIQEHPAYKQILEVRDSPLPLNIRYVNSWVELDKKSMCKLAPNTTLNVVLVIQMRYFSDYFKLAKDLVLFTNHPTDLDEDDIDDI
jgi:hypothetical protein